MDKLEGELSTPPLANNELLLLESENDVMDVLRNKPVELAFGSGGTR
jgi:hypothetical protein